MNNQSINSLLQSPVVTKEFEKFDFQNYDNEKGYNIIKLPDGSINQYQKQSYGYVIRIQPANSYFTLIKQFYKNGNIKSKGLIFNSGDFEKGIWYFFNENGGFEKEENHDTLFKFAFEDVYGFLQKEKIPITIGFIEGGFHTTIVKDVSSNGPGWIINWLKDVSRMPNIIEEIILDGNTGKVVRKSQYEYSNN